MRTRLFALLAAVGVMLSACGINSIPTAEENAKARWADVQASYQRRANLIPNLVATVRGAAASEERILTGVTQARADATRITVTPDQLTDPAAMQRFQEAQSRLSAAIIPLQRLQEAYPNLQSQQNFATLMSQLEGTENRITIAIRDYNEAVRAFNTEIRTFPSVIGARIIYGAEPMVPFEATVPNADVAPTVDFDTNSGAP
ncbi:LemA family protein [Sphingosinicella sp. CPCC 101087]|uniref:LemA family protein n=1 Tax=Sphingosinicella sp. CPCC 101087 TaxID=2497754 RepID=UPI00101BC5B9|nr:LemA family protein [Sphingosinicella sp. CPCC 101087]